MKLSGYCEPSVIHKRGVLLQLPRKLTRTPGYRLALPFIYCGGDRPSLDGRIGLIYALPEHAPRSTRDTHPEASMV